eukprot:766523-Hanusia_phi.AAC.5
MELQETRVSKSPSLKPIRGRLPKILLRQTGAMAIVMPKLIASYPTSLRASERGEGGKEMGGGSAVKVTAPVEITSYSKDATENITIPASRIRLYKKPQLPYDLNVGIVDYVAKKEAKVTLEPVLRALSQAQFSMSRSSRPSMETPYNNKDPWKIKLRKESSVIYMDVVKLEETSSQSPRSMRKFQYWGYKFEDACTSGAGDQSHVDANEEYCSVFKISIGDNKLVLAAEMDCIEPEDEGQREHGSAGNRRYVEIKTSR